MVLCGVGMSWIYHDDHWTNLDQYSCLCIYEEPEGDFSIQMFLKVEENGLSYHYMTENMFKTKKKAVGYLNKVMDTMRN